MNLQFFNPLRWKKSFLMALLAAFVVVWFTFIDSYSLKTRSSRKNRPRRIWYEKTRRNRVQSKARGIALRFGSSRYAHYLPKK